MDIDPLNNYTRLMNLIYQIYNKNELSTSEQHTYTTLKTDRGLSEIIDLQTYNLPQNLIKKSKSDLTINYLSNLEVS